MLYCFLFLSGYLNLYIINACKSWILSYNRTRNEDLSFFFHPESLVLKMLVLRMSDVIVLLWLTLLNLRADNECIPHTCWAGETLYFSFFFSFFWEIFYLDCMKLKERRRKCFNQLGKWLFPGLLLSWCLMHYSAFMFLPLGLSLTIFTKDTETLGEWKLTDDASVSCILLNYDYPK